MLTTDTPFAPPHERAAVAGAMPAHRWRLPRVPRVVMAAMVITAVLSALIFSVSEVVFAQAVTMQQRMAVLTEARVNALKVESQVQQALARHWAYLGTQDEAQLQAQQQAYRQAVLHSGLMQGLLVAYPDLLQEAQALGGVLQSDMDVPRAGQALGLLDRLDQSLLTALNRQQDDLSLTLSRQRVGTALLAGLSLFFLAVLAVRAIRHFYDQDRQRQLLSTQALRLEAAVRQRTNELNDLSTYLQKQSEVEKASLARELHDELGSLLTAARLDIAWLQGRNPEGDTDGLERLNKLSSVLDQALNIKRRVIENLQPSLLTHLGLGAALIWYVEQTCDSAGLVHEVKVPQDGVQADAETGLALYRIVQEALNNTIRHARASAVFVELNEGIDGHVLRIEDDGSGIVDFHPEKLSHGLAGMRQRATALGGQFDIRSRRGRGTCIEVKVPRRKGGATDTAAPALVTRDGVPSMPEAGDQEIKPCVTA